MPNTHLTKVITLKCDPAWVAALDETARRCGLSRSALIRQAVDGVRPVERPDRGYHELVVQLVKLGTLYNQTVRLAHQTRYKTGGLPLGALLEQVETHQATLQLILETLIASDTRSTP